MCEGGLHARLLHRCSAALADEDHALHPPLQRMFERLASQALEPMVLRYVVLLGKNNFSVQFFLLIPQAYTDRIKLVDSSLTPNIPAVCCFQLCKPLLVVFLTIVNL